MKVIGSRSRSQQQKCRKFRFPQCKETSFGCKWGFRIWRIEWCDRRLRSRVVCLRLEGSLVFMCQGRSQRGGRAPPPQSSTEWIF